MLPSEEDDRRASPSSFSECRAAFRASCGLSMEATAFARRALPTARVVGHEQSQRPEEKPGDEPEAEVATALPLGLSGEEAEVEPA